MRRIVIAGAFVGVGVVTARLAVPKLHGRMLTACREMFERMPDDFPPKRMMGGIEEIRANTARALEILEERPAMATIDEIENAAVLVA
jgi:hypothetical protein